MASPASRLQLPAHLSVMAMGRRSGLALRRDMWICTAGDRSVPSSILNWVIKLDVYDLVLLLDNFNKAVVYVSAHILDNYIAEDV